MHEYDTGIGYEAYFECNLTWPKVEVCTGTQTKTKISNEWY